MDKPELRFAVAMKGGVSLAVWIGGACRELTLLTGDDPAYRDLTSHLSRVKVDVISGSSAGGLNGVLLAQSEAYGAAFDDRTRNTWLELADLGTLARNTSGEAPLSLLRGDHAFYPLLAERMGRLAPGDDAGHGRVRLLITATRVHERPRELYPTTGSPVHAASSAAWFSFTSPIGGPAGQSHHITAAEDSMRRLAYAARCTSSFPGAFEPGRVDVMAGATPYPAMAGCCSETGVDDDGRGTVELMDGGVLDNIPVAWALRGIAAQPASGPVDRWLLYLDPSPHNAPFPPDPAGAGAPVSSSPVSFLQLISRAKKVRSSVESLLDDADELAASSRATRGAEAALQLALSVGAADIDAAQAQLDHYARENGRAEAARARQLLLNPEGVTVGDPLPVPPPPFAGSRSGKLPRFLLELTYPQYARIGGPEDGWGDLTAVGASATTPLVAARALTVLLRSIQDVEAETDDNGPAFRTARQRLYAVRDVVEHVVALRDRHLLLAAQETDALDQAYELATRRTGRDLQLAIGACSTPDTIKAEWWHDLLRQLPSHAVSGDAAPCEAPYEVLWEGVLSCRDGLIAVSAIHDLKASTAQWSAEVLAASEVLTGLLRPDPLSSPSDPSFAVISAAAPSPLAGMFWDDARTLSPDDLPGRKLCGNELFNFGGFLSARWRHHDWIWGRLDAIPTIMAALHHQHPEADQPFSLDEGRQVFIDGFGATLGVELWNVAGMGLLWNDDATDRSRRIAVWTARRQLEILREERAFQVDTDESLARPEPDPAPAPALQDPGPAPAPVVSEDTTPIIVEEVVVEEASGEGLVVEEVILEEITSTPTSDAQTSDAETSGTQASSAEAARAEPVVEETAAEWSAQAKRMAELGLENPVHLLGKPALRRILLRLGIGAFRSLSGIKPIDQGPPRHPAAPSIRTTGLWAFVLRVLVGPFVVPPLLFSLTSPLAALGAALLTYVSLSVAVGHWATLTHLLMVPALVLAVVGIALRAYRSKLSAMGAGARRIAWVSALVFFALWLTLWIRDATVDLGAGGPWLAGILAIVAFLVTQADVAADLLAGDQRHGWNVLKGLVGGAVATGIVVALVALAPVPSIVVLYAGLGCALLTLYYWSGLGASAPISYPVPRNYSEGAEE